LGVGIEIVFQFLYFGFGGSVLILPILDILLCDLEVVLQFGDQLLKLLALAFVVFVFVHERVQLQLLFFQLFDIVVLGLDEVVQPVDLLRHECDFVFVVFEVNLYVLEFVQG
jgi:hypothetical protein